MSVHNLNEVSAEARHLRTASAGECYPHYPHYSGGVLVVEGPDGRGMRQPRRERYSQNGLINSRPKSEYISAAGISALDIRTRLRITEAELAIVQREVVDLKTERKEMLVNSKQFEESWRFSVTLCGQIVEEKNELQKKYEQLEQAIKAARQHTPEMKAKKLSKSNNKSSIDHLKVSLATQTRVCEMLEQERDRAFDDYEMAQAQLYSLFQQYQDLASSCSEVARERDRLKAEVQLVRDELQRYEPDGEVSSSRSSLKKMGSTTCSENSLVSVGMATGGGNCETDAETSSDPQFLLQQLREARVEKERSLAKYEQLMRKAEQFQKQLYRAEEDRRQALATSEALTSLWQKKFDKAQNENYDLRQELLTAHDRISLLQDHLAVTRIHSRGTTPLRPSPPDNIHASADHTYNHTYTSTVTSEANHGRFSPVKAPSGSSSLTGSSNGSLWFSGQSSSTSPVSEGLKSREDGEPVAGGGVAKGSSAVPQRTSSFHGFNKINPYYSASLSQSSSQHHTYSRATGHPISRTVSMKTHQELAAPSKSALHVQPPHMKHHHTSSEGDKRRLTDAEGSWI